MIRLRRGTVTALGERRPGAIELTVEVDGEAAHALAYPDLCGPVAVGDRVLLNTGAVVLGLGTGGTHLVISVDGGTSTELGPGRVMKVRYTPMQTLVATVEEDHAEVLDDPRGLAGTPVVAVPLHSMIAHVAAGAKVAGAQRVAYVMTDGAALPGAFSRLVPRLRGGGVLDTFITAGQAFGGEYEAATMWTGMLAAVVIAGADVVVVSDGPGNLGTNTRWGSSALGSGHALNAAEALRGRPVAALRVSFADARERHRGVSHHSLTALGAVCTVEANVAVPALEEPQRTAVWSALRDAGLDTRHRLIEAAGEPAIEALGRAGVDVTSMGRSVADDPSYFLAAGAAGILAGRMAARSREWKRDAATLQERQ